MLKTWSFNERLEGLASPNPLQHMARIAENVLNPNRYHLSNEAKKHLLWMYVLFHEEKGNVTRSARKIGISRQWLSTLKGIFERHKRDPRSLEPRSRAPLNRKKRKRIPEEYEQLIIKERDASPGWGKEKIKRIMKRDHDVDVGSSTVNRCLHEHKRIDPKISEKNTQAWRNKKLREQDSAMRPILRVKHRPPKEIKDYKPGSLIEKDMKYIVKQGQFTNTEKQGARENFWYQHTEIDSFTRIRTLEIVEHADSATATDSHQRAIQRFPFPIACANTDNGSENNGDFSKMLQDKNVFHFYSKVGTPTDNPRVERSHLTDDIEFYNRIGVRKTFEEQREATKKHEWAYNYKRPHQALGYLTPMEFYELWKKNPLEAYAIVGKYRRYLAGQRRRLASARRIKKKEQIEAVMQFIDAKLSSKKVELEKSKFNLIHCQLCSWT